MCRRCRRCCCCCCCGYCCYRWRFRLQWDNNCKRRRWQWWWRWWRRRHKDYNNNTTHTKHTNMKNNIQIEAAASRKMKKKWKRTRTHARAFSSRAQTNNPDDGMHSDLHSAGWMARLYVCVCAREWMSEWVYIHHETAIIKCRWANGMYKMYYIHDKTKTASLRMSKKLNEKPNQSEPNSHTF